MRLTIYSKPGCHLCDEMKSVVRRVIVRSSSDAEIPLEDIDISNNPDLLDRYDLEVPVLVMDGRKIAKFRVSEEELTRMLEARKR